MGIFLLTLEVPTTQNGQTLKQLMVFDDFVGLSLKGLMGDIFGEVFFQITVNMWILWIGHL